MDYKYYERKINDVIMKCPIEAGVEILVYNVLDSILDAEKVSLVDINRLWKNRDDRLTTKGGVSDIAVLPNDFVYKKKFHIKTKYEEKEYIIISKSYDYLLDINGSRIYIDNILDINA